MTSLKGKKVLITAGPTREYLDPVRFISNGSTGQMGIALALEARRLGAKVTLILGPIPGPAPKAAGLTVVPVVSAWDMGEATKKHLSGTQVFIGAAAVSDYRTMQPLTHKIKRHDESMTLKLYGNPDIIAMVGHHPTRRPKIVVGFALETDHLLQNAALKLLRKRMDWIVANRETNMGKPVGSAVLLNRWAGRIDLPMMTKPQLAKKIWKAVLDER